MFLFHYFHIHSYIFFLITWQAHVLLPQTIMYCQILLKDKKTSTKYKPFGLFSRKLTANHINIGNYRTSSKWSTIEEDN